MSGSGHQDQKVRKLRKENEGKVFAISYYDYPEACCGDSAQSKKL
jgi:hypothetical protein